MHLSCECDPEKQNHIDLIRYAGNGNHSQCNCHEGKFERIRSEKSHRMTATFACRLVNDDNMNENEPNAFLSTFFINAMEQFKL